ncbi:hypothetical protein GCK32_000012 [Trichostrongylus colubriformis]|uniref:Uncharacterized protein n=1 Tax=Trichostrongylus colubriformis TaxID=6319 RepID=A0AAN8FHD7_TRICO
MQTDPLSAALAERHTKLRPLPTISRTPLLLQFTPFGPPVVPSCCYSFLRFMSIPVIFPCFVSSLLEQSTIICF